MAEQEQEKDKRLNDLLDSMLSRYSSADPRPGLETRILAKVKDAEAPKRPWFWNLRWLAAGAVGVAVAAVIVFVLFSRTAAPGPQPQVQTNVKTPPTRVTPPEETTLSKTVILPDRSRRSASVPTHETLVVAARLEVFPKPVPLSEQEILLLRYMASTPREELIAQSHPDEPPADLGQDTPPVRDLTQVPQRSSNTQ